MPRLASGDGVVSRDVEVYYFLIRNVDFLFGNIDICTGVEKNETSTDSPVIELGVPWML